MANPTDCRLGFQTYHADKQKLLNCGNIPILQAQPFLGPASSEPFLQFLRRTERKMQMFISLHVIPLCVFFHSKNSESNTVLSKSQNTFWSNSNFLRKLKSLWVFSGINRSTVFQLVSGCKQLSIKKDDVTDLSFPRLEWDFSHLKFRLLC